MSMYTILIRMTVALRVVMMNVAAASQVYNNIVGVAVIRSHRVSIHIQVSHHGRMIQWKKMIMNMMLIMMMMMR